MGDARGPFILPPGSGELVDIGGLGVHFKVWGAQTAGRVSVVEHPMEPGRLVPPHVHADEDELSYVLEGTFGVRLGDLEGEAGPGSYVWKPRGVPHTFWNPGPVPARLIEIIVPAGFERFFDALGAAGRTSATPDEFFARRAELAVPHRLGFVDGWDADLKARHGLRLLGEP